MDTFNLFLGNYSPHLHYQITDTQASWTYFVKFFSQWPGLLRPLFDKFRNVIISVSDKYH